MADPTNGKDLKNTAADNKPSKAEIAKAISELKFRTNKELPVIDDATGKQMVENGKPKVRYVPDLIDMKPEHVLNAYYDGEALVIVSKDGSKYRK